jgi:hypothetical protein
VRVSDERLGRIRAKHPRAYEKWTEADDTLLKGKLAADTGIEELSRLLHRQPNAILSRLRKLASLADQRASASKDPCDVSVSSLYVGFSVKFEWVAMLRANNERYVFPQSITEYMKCLYGGPALYRWSAIRDSPVTEQRIYIGQTSRLCPDRVDGYLHPRDSEATNRRLNRQLDGYLTQGFRIQLEVLQFDQLVIGDLVLTHEDLGEQSVRLFLENLLVTYYRHSNCVLLNR